MSKEVRDNIKPLLPVYVYYQNRVIYLTDVSKQYVFNETVKIPLHNFLMTTHAKTEIELQNKLKYKQAKKIKQEYEEIKKKYFEYTEFMLLNPELFI